VGGEDLHLHVVHDFLKVRSTGVHFSLLGYSIRQGSVLFLELLQ